MKNLIVILFALILLAGCTKEEAAPKQDTSAIDINLITGPVPEGAKKCACGEHPTLYEYHVRQGTGCCTGELLMDLPAVKLSYVDGGAPGVWKLTKTEKIKPADVQLICCAKS